VVPLDETLELLKVELLYRDCRELNNPKSYSIRGKIKLTARLLNLLIFGHHKVFLEILAPKEVLCHANFEAFVCVY
jgi:hypothetical protein